MDPIKRPAWPPDRGTIPHLLFSLFVASFFGALVVGCKQIDPGDGAAPALALKDSALIVNGARFVDVASRAGLNYRWVISGKRPINILQGIGNGCAFLDYNNDGNLDILLVGPKLALYQGDGHGHFTDVTHQTGLDKIHGHFLGCAVGDYDNDGCEDIYLTAYRGGALLHNQHGKAFLDVTKQAGIAPQPWGTSAAFVDIDNDGKLDLYIGNYISFSANTQPQLCKNSGAIGACGPEYYGPLKGILYRDTGNGKFVNVTERWGAQNVAGKTLGIACADFDGGGYQSLYVANDETAGSLFENKGGRLVDIGKISGTGLNAQGRVQGGMGADWGDYDNDGRLDLAVTTFAYQSKPVYHNDGHGLFTEKSPALGMDPSIVRDVSFGVKWLDFDNNGWLDLIISSGHVQENIGEVDKNTSYRMATKLYQNNNGRRFSDVSSALIGLADRPILGRGLSVGDFDNDGKIDALVVDSEGQPLLLHNETPHVGHWLEINLIGVKSNRDGMGALITVEAGGLKLLRQCTTGGSYMSASDKRVHIGVGSVKVAQEVRILWPSGHVDTYKNVRCDQIITLREGALSPILAH